MRETYFNSYDDFGERKSLIPSAPWIPLRDALEASVLLARKRQEDEIGAQADFVLEKEEEVLKQQQKDLEEALETLRGLMREGEEGFYPGKILAVADFIKNYR